MYSCTASLGFPKAKSLADFNFACGNLLAYWKP
jgi:hypothetical protein